MTELVPASEIEEIVGAQRHPTHHIGRVVSAEETVYILHSHKCRDSGLDLRECRYSVALDRGIDERLWPKDRAVRLSLRNGELMPDAWRRPTAVPPVSPTSRRPHGSMNP